jgi:hypothetical protein
MMELLYIYFTQVLVLSITFKFSSSQMAQVARSQILNELFLGTDDLVVTKANLSHDAERKDKIDLLEDIFIDQKGNNLKIDRKTTKTYSMQQISNSTSAKLKNREIKLFYRPTTRDFKDFNIRVKGSNGSTKISTEHTSILTFYNLDESFFIIKINKELSLVVFCFSIVFVLAFGSLAFLVHCVSPSKKDAYYFCKYHQVY